MKTHNDPLDTSDSSYSTTKLESTEIIRDHPLFLTPWYTFYVGVSGVTKCYFFEKICVRTKWMILKIIADVT